MPHHSIHSARITVCFHSMWCEVQVCRGPGGERLKRAQWTPLGRGKLSVDYEPRNDPPGMVGKLVKYDCGRELPLGSPIFDARVRTFDAGFLVIGYQIVAEGAGEVVREYRQAWYCVPAHRAA
jgi:hypothetical protein